MRLLFDVGGTNTRLALAGGGERLGEVEHRLTDPSSTGVDKLIRDMREVVGSHRLTAVTGGLPGHISRSMGLRPTPNLPGWAGIDVTGRLEDALGVPVVIENDAAVVGLGEAVYGAGRGTDLVVYMTVSTGVNGARIVRGTIDVSMNGFELGAMLIPDEAGRLVPLESLTGGVALARRYGRPPWELDDPVVWQQEAKWLALALYNTLLHWSPQVVIYGGAMMRDISLEAIRSELEALPPVFAGWPELRLAQLGDEGGLYGALALGLKKNSRDQ